ncbi:DnaJ domain-containing protein [Glomus cerebriforme]|uniref:DnaJ domain-containing protein n=1 Tax=Glomus cerebriforme TaxID=658196 RepID=A0A397SRZ9_9GLOM|nr:DnaJ domain-containing protein [Glomus cerebriforme]
MSQTQFVLSVPPPSWTDGEEFRIHCGISDGLIRNVEPVGSQFLAHARRKLNNHSFSEDDRIQEEATTEQTEEIISEDSEEETPELLNRDPKDWKEQDHYAVLGLSKYRWKATDEQIKQAHRRKVLKHHPDKKASSGNTNDDAFFKCIQKAHEILSDPVKRRQFDSVDEAIDDSLPSTKVKGDFFEIYGPIFEREARFSNKTPVPMLGDTNTSKLEVEAFYDFWYNFDSWRSFEYLDKDDTDSTDNRDDKRYIERKNKAERAKHKKEDNIRLRKIIDQALSLDPRIQRFKQEEKAAKEAKKKEKEEAAKRAEEATRKAAEEEKQKKEMAEAEAKQKQAEEKKEKAAKKKAIRNERKNIKTHIKDYNYFYPDNETPPVDVIDIQLSELDSLFENLSLEDLQNVRKQLDSVKDRYSAKKVLIEEAKRLVSAGTLSADSIKHFSPGI